MFRRARIASLLTLAAATLIASAALAVPTLPGINIRWDNCYADGGVMNRTFACDTNTGTDLMAVSVQLDTGMLNVSGMEIRVSLKSSAPPLPAWWDFKNSGSCRQLALDFVAFSDAVLPPGGTCVDWGQGHGGGGAVAGYHVDEIGPGSAVILIAAAVPSSNLVQLDPVTEYTVGVIRMNHSNTVGTGACSGCDTPVCILFTSLNITTPVLANNRLLTTGANTVDSQIIHWQSGHLVNLVNTCTGTFSCTTQFDCVAGVTASRRSTWGAVKSLYR